MKWLLKQSVHESDEDYKKRMKLANKFVLTIVALALIVAHLGPFAMHTVQKAMGSKYLNIVNPNYDWRDIFWYLSIQKADEWTIYDLRPEQHLIDNHILIIAQNKAQIEQYKAKLKNADTQNSAFYKKRIERLIEDIERRSKNIKRSRELHRQRKIKLEEMKQKGFPNDKFIIKL